MAVEATLYSKWRNKWLIMSLFCFGFAGWCYYDGTVTYPNDNLRVAAFAKVTDSNEPGLFDALDEPDGWSFDQAALAKALAATDAIDAIDAKDYEAFAKLQGWTTDEPSKPHKDQDIYTQYGMLAICVALGVTMIVMVLLHLGRKLLADDKGLTSMTGKFITYESITEIDMRRWDSKGIAYVHYEEGGEEGRIKIDDYVFENGDMVLKEVEEHTGLGEPVTV